jgi:hypothetical protein
MLLGVPIWHKMSCDRKCAGDRRANSAYIFGLRILSRRISSLVRRGRICRIVMVVVRHCAHVSFGGRCRGRKGDQNKIEAIKRDGADGPVGDARSTSVGRNRQDNWVLLGREEGLFVQ